MKEFCENDPCETEAVEEVPVSESTYEDSTRSFCATCHEAYTIGVQHGSHRPDEIPHPGRVARMAYTAITGRGGYTIGLAYEGTLGYSLEPSFGVFPTWEDARAKSAELNKALGLTYSEGLAIAASTMGEGV